MTSLFDPLMLRSVSVPNRGWLSPMCMYSSAATGPTAGAVTDFHFAHLAARALGGVGLVMTESTAVSAEGRISLYDLGLWNDAQTESYSRITDFVLRQGSVPAVQLGHAGRKASTAAQWDRGVHVGTDDGGWEAVGPSAVAYHGYATPRALDTTGIRAVTAEFADAAKRALVAGFKVVEIHAAHGYLLHQFMSPQTNRRADEYGGSFENRIRLAVEVVDAVRAVWPERLPLLFRLSATDWLTENPEDDRTGWTVEESVELARILGQRGVDMIDVSSGGLVHNAKISTGPGYQVPLSRAIGRGAGIPVSAVGLITDPAHADRLIRDGDADAIFLGRELLRNPNWIHHAAGTLGHLQDWPVQYGWAVG